MEERRIRWATNWPNGQPVIIDSIVADIDPVTGEASLSQRGQEVIDEVVESAITPTKAYIVPAIDLPHAVHLLIQAKYRAGVPVRSRLPDGFPIEEPVESGMDDRNVVYPQEIDHILLAMYERMSNECVNLLGKATEAVPLDTLHNGSLGNALRRIWCIANEFEQGTRDEVEDLSALVSTYLPPGLDTNLHAFFVHTASDAISRVHAHHG